MNATCLVLYFLNASCLVSRYHAWYLFVSGTVFSWLVAEVFCSFFLFTEAGIHQVAPIEWFLKEWSEFCVNTIPRSELNGENNLTLPLE